MLESKRYADVLERNTGERSQTQVQRTFINIGLNTSQINRDTNVEFPTFKHERYRMSYSRCLKVSRANVRRPTISGRSVWDVKIRRKSQVTLPSCFRRSTTNYIECRIYVVWRLVVRTFVVPQSADVQLDHRLQQVGGSAAWQLAHALCRAIIYILLLILR